MVALLASITALSVLQQPQRQIPSLQAGFAGMASAITARHRFATGTRSSTANTRLLVS
jgi:hypothetical protein